jgi:CheY-like chemotaxis protein
MKTILFIDDDRFLTTLYRTKLQNEGYTVEVALGGKEALGKLKTFHPHIIILDLNMPEMNGVETLKRIQSNPDLRNIPVIVFSTGYVQQLSDEVHSLGIEKLLTKSQCSPNQLLSEIESTLQGGLQDGELVGSKICSQSVTMGATDDNHIENLLNSDSETQRAMLVALSEKLRPELEMALATESGSKSELLGRAMQKLLEDFRNHPERITQNSVQAFKKGIENLDRLTLSE